MTSEKDDLKRRRDLVVSQIKVAKDEEDRRRLYDELESILQQLRDVES